MSERRFYTPAELAAMGLPDMPTTDRAIRLMADRGGWRRPDAEFPHHPNGFWRKAVGRGGGYEYTLDVLPMRARLALIMREQKAAAAAPEPLEAQKGDLRIASMWQRYHALSDRLKAKAKAAHEALTAAEDLAATGMERTPAYMLAASQAGVSLRTLYNWRDQVGSLPREHWLPALAPKYTGRQTEAECHPDAFEAIKGLYLRPERPRFSDCYRHLLVLAAEHGWSPIPSERTLQRRIEKLPETVRVLRREGAEALARMRPSQERDKSALHALEVVNADGHKFDVFVRWPGEKNPVRPVLVAWQDIYSGMILSWRLDRAETAHSVLLALGDLVETWGIPDHAILDNGRNFASKWLSGGIATRYRFKVKAEDPDGVLKVLGVQVHWATPYHGQAKPIERAFRDLASSIAKHPALAGAYTGNTPMTKPENYGSKAVDLALFERVVAAGIAEHNARAGRRAKVCNGRSFEETFRASYAEAMIRKPSAAQRQLWLLAAEGLRVRPDSTIHLHGNRYHCDALLDLRGHKVVARFDPDALHDGVHVYRLSGEYLAHAECIEAEGFLDVEAARRHAASRKAWLKATKAAAEAEAGMSIETLADLLPDPEPSRPVAAPKVVRPVFGGRGGRAPATGSRRARRRVRAAGAGLEPRPERGRRGRVRPAASQFINVL